MRPLAVPNAAPLHPVTNLAATRIASAPRRLAVRIRQYTVTAADPRRTATGPGPIYLYKPILHLVLPTWLHHIIVLDTDLFLFEDIAGLWHAAHSVLVPHLIAPTSFVPASSLIRAV